MRTRDELIATLQAALDPHGLRVLGCWTPATREESSELPRLPQAALPAHVCMVGQVGSACWRAFFASPFHADGLPGPMDRWSQAIAQPLAQRFGARAVFPSDGPPYLPFQQWARAADPRLQDSPLMLQIHPEHGLWQAYRFALVLPSWDGVVAAGPAGRGIATAGSVPHRRPSCAAAPSEDAARHAARAVDAEAADPARTQEGVALAAPASICASCAGQPCLQACPVDAFTPAHGYVVERCAGHLHGADRGSCMALGCRARRACPVGAALRYEPAHAAFHMAAFASRH